VTYDWLRVAMAAVGYVSAIRAISVPYPPRDPSVVPTPRATKVVYGVGIGAVLLFVIYFLVGGL
jgi:hypothetical protein